MIYMKIYIFAVKKRNKTKWYFRHLSYVSEGFDTIDIADAEAGKYREEYSRLDYRPLV